MSDCGSDLLGTSSSVEVNGWTVWYERFGSGPKPVLLLSGAIGTGRTDFMPQLEGEYALDFEKFTIIAVEAPGWGRSRPPVRKYGINTYNNDAQCFHAVMGCLGYERYSIIGWSDGAKVALLMAVQYSQCVESMVLTAISTYVSDSCLKFFKSAQNIECWGEEKVNAYLKCYETKTEIQNLWNRFVRFAEFYNQYFPEDMYKNRYHLIQFPVLVLHGQRDPMIDDGQPLNVCRNIKNARLELFSTGSHDLHQKFPSTFKKLTEQHLLK